MKRRDFVVSGLACASALGLTASGVAGDEKNGKSKDGQKKPLKRRDRPDLTLTAVAVQFHTTDDDKDQDSKLTMIVKQGQKTIAHSESFAGSALFPDDSDSDFFELGEVDKKFTLGEIVKGVTVRLSFEPVGDDNWWFEFSLRFKFSDDSTVTMHMDTNTKFDDDELTVTEWSLQP
jgi:hypothetical protein